MLLQGTDTLAAVTEPEIEGVDLALDVKWLGRADLLAFIVRIHNRSAQDVPAGRKLGIFDKTRHVCVETVTLEAPLPPGETFHHAFTVPIVSKDFERNHTIRWLDDEA